MVYVIWLRRLNVCNIESLEEYSIKIDLILMNKLLHYLNNCINLGNNIKLSVSSDTRCDMYKLYVIFVLI